MAIKEGDRVIVKSTSKTEWAWGLNDTMRRMKGKCCKVTAYCGSNSVKLNNSSNSWHIADLQELVETKSQSMNIPKAKQVFKFDPKEI
jgi:hypothetical protein